MFRTSPLREPATITPRYEAQRRQSDWLGTAELYSPPTKVVEIDHQLRFPFPERAHA
jgi:hypothetical protein